VTTVLLAYDGSSSSRAAIGRAAALVPGAEAVVASVSHGLRELEDAGSTARVALQTAIQRLRGSALEEAAEVAEEGAELARAAGLDAQPRAVRTDGPLWAALADAAREAQADLIASGTQGHGRVARAFVGSVSTALVRNAGLPVLVVPEDPPEPSGPLLIGYDGSDLAGRAIENAGRLLSGREAVVVNIWRSRIRRSIAGRLFERAPLREVRETILELDGLFEQWAQETVEQGVELARAHGLVASDRLVETAGPPAHALLGLADELEAPAVVVGRAGSGGFADQVLGSVTQTLLHAAARPVLVA
jgi:nucleotide-binding universal stress UspA family protein